MEDEYVVLTTEDGDEIELEVIGQFEHEGNSYIILASFDYGEDGVLIMREDGRDYQGDKTYSFPDDEDMDFLTDLAIKALSGDPAPEEARQKAEPDITDLELAIESQTDFDRKAVMCLAAGDAFERGTHGAITDLDKACDYFGQGAELGNVQCLFRRGMLLINNFWGEDKELFSAGVYDVAQSYSLGYEPAKNMLQKLLDSEVFPKIKSIDALLSFVGIE